MAGFVQGSINGTNVASTTCSVSLTGVAAGNALVAVVLSGGSGTTTTGVSDGVNTWARVVNRVFITGAGGSDIWVAYNVAAGNPTVTSTISASGVNHKLLVAEITGLTTSGFDQSAGQSQSATTSPTSGSTPTTTQASEYLFGFLAQASGAAAITEDAAFTQRLDDNGNTAQSLHFADRIVSATGAYAYSPTIASSKNTVTLLATFKIAAVSGKLFRPATLDGLGSGGPFFGGMN